MRPRPKTQKELRADLKTFEVVWKREMAHIMRNAVTGARGRRVPRRGPRSKKDCVRMAESLELRRSLDNSIERMRAFREGRPMPVRYEPKAPRLPGGSINPEVQGFRDCARAARDRLLRGL